MGASCIGPFSFWEGRYKRIAILDEASLLATIAYIDLNPVPAGVAATPETSAFTSIKSRVDHIVAQGKLETLRDGSSYASKVNVQKGHWLLPIEDRRDQNGKGLAGLIRGVSLSGYLQLVNGSSRLIRPGKISLPDTVLEILTRLQIEAADWKSTLEKLVRSAKRSATTSATRIDCQKLTINAGAGISETSRALRPLSHPRMPVDGFVSKLFAIPPVSMRRWSIGYEPSAFQNCKRNDSHPGE